MIAISYYNHCHQKKVQISNYIIIICFYCFRREKMASGERTHLLRDRGTPPQLLTEERSSIQSDIAESPMFGMSRKELFQEHKEENSLTSGDRSSVLFTLERAVEILRSQVDREEQQLEMRYVYRSDIDSLR